VQRSGELRWDFNTNTRQLCKYETTCSIYIIWTKKGYIAVFMKKNKNPLNPILMKKKNDSRNHTHVGNHMQKSGKLHWRFCSNTG